MQTQNFTTMYVDIQNQYKKILEHLKNSTCDKITMKEIKLTNSKLQKMLNDIDQVQRQNLDLSALLNYQEKFVLLAKQFQNAKTVKTTKKQFTKKIAKILGQNTNQQTPIESKITPHRQKQPQISKINPKNQVLPVFNQSQQLQTVEKPVKQSKIDPPQNSAGFSFAKKQTAPLPLKSDFQMLSKQQEIEYREKLNSILKKINDSNTVSFKKQFENFESGVQVKRKKFTSTISQGKNQIRQKEQIISRLIFQNNQLRQRLNQQTIQYQQYLQQKKKSSLFTKKESPFQIQVQTFKQPQQSYLNINLKKESSNKNQYNKQEQFKHKDQLLDVQKYQVYNELLKKQNEEIYSKLHELEQMMEQLSKQNMKLKQFEKSGGSSSRLIPTNNTPSQKMNKQLSQSSFSINEKSFQEMNQLEKKQIQFQYILPNQKNDIMKIISKQPVIDDRSSNQSSKRKIFNMIQSKQSRPLIHQQQNILPSDINKSISHSQHSFDTFKAANSIQQFQIQNEKKYYQNQSLIKKTQIQNTNKTLLTRNKVAFFKNSLIILKDDPTYEIAFKKSALNKDADTCRFIFYVNNKSLKPQRLQINYEYDNQIYSVNSTQKITTINGGSQSREQLLIYYKDNKKNSRMNFIICHFIFRQITYDIILPVLFLEFKQGIFKMNNIDTKTIIISPDKQFASAQLMNTLIPLVNHDKQYNLEMSRGQKQRSETVINTKKGIQGLILQWQNNLLKITGDQKWIEALAWVLSQVKI